MIKNKVFLGVDNEMDKKSFVKGLLSGICAMVFLVGGIFCASTIQAMTAEKMPLDKKINLITSYLDKFYVEDIDTQKMEEGIYAGLVASLGDPYTTYISSEGMKAFLTDTQGVFNGIGISVTVNTDENSILVVAPIHGTPAHKAGILPNDRIIRVDDKDVSGDKLNEAVSMMQGEVGTAVKVTVWRPSENKTIDFNIKRDVISEETVTYKMLPDQIGYLRITDFKETTYDQFQESYTALQKETMKGLIIDVRNNPGGLLDVVEKIADELVPEGTLVYTIDKEGKRQDFVSDANHIKIPLCLLVNGNSASASEILSGAVQDMGAGKLVGTQTFGKGLVQGIFPLKDGSGIKITIQKYYTPKGVCIQGTGITPDYVVELPKELQYTLNIPEEEDIQLKKAVEVIKSQLN